MIYVTKTHLIKQVYMCVCVYHAYHPSEKLEIAEGLN